MPKDIIQTPVTEGTSDTTTSMLTVLGTQTAEETRQQFAALSHVEKLKALQKVTEYTGAPTVRIDNFLGERLELLGMVIQRNATVKLEEPIPQPDGSMKEYTTEDRVIWKVKPPKGEAVVISFMSMAIAGFCEDFIAPIFGQGDFAAAVPLIVRQVAKDKGRTYNIQIVA